MTLRGYRPSDLEAIGNMDPLAALQIQYHKGVLSESIICTDAGSGLAGFAFLLDLQATDDKNRQKMEFTVKTNGANSSETELRSLLLDGLLEKFRALGSGAPARAYSLQAFCASDEIQEMQFLLEHGFGIRSAIPVLKFDLAKQTNHAAIPTGVAIERVEFNEGAMRRYLEADRLAGPILNGEADVWFNTGGPGFECFAATCSGEVIGAISIWDITEENAATENIFVVPAYRRKGIARELIATALDVLKERNKKIATLSVDGMNLDAIRLYLSCGYELYYHLIKMTYE